jgi:hypothetical protein
MTEPVHFRGLPSPDYTAWRPICSTRDAPVKGTTSTNLSEIACATCRKILRLDSRQWKAPDTTLNPQSRELLDSKRRASGET